MNFLYQKHRCYHDGDKFSFQRKLIYLRLCCKIFILLGPYSYLVLIFGINAIAILRCLIDPDEFKDYEIKTVLKLNNKYIFSQIDVFMAKALADRVYIFQV